MTLETLAIDPGLDGGAVLLSEDGQTAIAAYGWRKADAGFTLRNANGLRMRAKDLHDVAEIISTDTHGAYLLVVEGLFVPRAPRPRPGQHWTTRDRYKAEQRYSGRLAHLLTLAEVTGQLQGPLMGAAHRVERPLASTWRPDVLELPPNASSVASEQRAIWAMNVRKPALVKGLDALAKDPHVCEAACMAVYGHRLQAKGAA